MLLPLTTWWRPRLARLARALRLRVLVPAMHALSRIEAESSAQARAARDLAKMRHDICSTCPLLTKSRTCDRRRGGCGCFMPVKVQLKNAKCPQGRW